MVYSVSHLMEQSLHIIMSQLDLGTLQQLFEQFATTKHSWEVGFYLCHLYKCVCHPFIQAPPLLLSLLSNRIDSSNQTLISLYIKDGNLSFPRLEVSIFSMNSILNRLDTRLQERPPLRPLSWSKGTPLNLNFATQSLANHPWSSQGFGDNRHGTGSKLASGN